MQFKKLNENKIRITLNIKDLEEQNIDFHSFMSNPLASQDLFFDMLEKAEKEIGFITKNYQIQIEALAMSSGDFILTVTRNLPDNNQISRSSRKKLKIKRKISHKLNDKMVYSFNTYEDFYCFIKFIKNQNINLKNISKNIFLCEYNGLYYLLFTKINSSNTISYKLNSFISEFGTYIDSSDIFISKLIESGNIVIKNSSFDNYIKYIN